MLLQLGIALSLTIGTSGLMQECPRAILTCEKSKADKSEYACSVIASAPDDDLPQYFWKVSAGRIVDGGKMPNVTIDASDVSSSSLLVTVTVKWPQEMKRHSVCAVSVMEKKIVLR